MDYDFEYKTAAQLDLVQLGVDVVERFNKLSDREQAWWIENYSSVNVNIFHPINLVQVLQKQEGNDVLKVYNILKEAEERGDVDLSKKWIVDVKLGPTICVDSLVEAACQLCNLLADLRYAKLCYLLGYDDENDDVRIIREALYVRSGKELDDIWVKVLKEKGIETV